MNREVLIAIILGFTIGLVVTYGVWIANRSLKDQESVSPIPTPVESTDDTNPDTSLKQPTSSQLKLIEPTPNTLTTEATYTVNGYTNPSHTVIIISENEQLTTDPDSQGEFTADITLTIGINNLTIYSLDSNGDAIRLDETIIRSQSEDE